MLKMGWTEPTLEEIKDSIVKSVLTSEHLIPLHAVNDIISPHPIYDKISDDTYYLRLYYHPYDYKYCFVFSIKPLQAWGSEKSCTFIADNLPEIKRAIIECIPIIQEHYDKTESERLSRIKSKEQETKCRTRLWTKFNGGK